MHLEFLHLLTYSSRHEGDIRWNYITKIQFRNGFETRKQFKRSTLSHLSSTTLYTH